MGHAVYFHLPNLTILYLKKPRLREIDISKSSGSFDSKSSLFSILPLCLDSVTSVFTKNKRCMVGVGLTKANFHLQEAVFPRDFLRAV